MRNKILLLFIALTSAGIFAQQTEGSLQPGESFTNSSDEVLFYLPRAKVIKMLNYQTRVEFDSVRIEKYQDLVSTMQLRVAACDSAITLRSLEADYWKMQLEKNDDELMQVQIDKEKLLDENQRIRKSRLYYTLAGIVASSIVYISLK